MGCRRRRAGRLAEHRQHLETACRAALAFTPRQERRWGDLVTVAQRYTILRERQAHNFTLAWPALRRAVLQLGQLLHSGGRLPLPTTCSS